MENTALATTEESWLELVPEEIYQKIWKFKTYGPTLPRDLKWDIQHWQLFGLKDTCRNCRYSWCWWCNHLLSYWLYCSSPETEDKMSGNWFSHTRQHRKPPWEYIKMCHYMKWDRQSYCTAQCYWMYLWAEINDMTGMVHDMWEEPPRFIPKIPYIIDEVSVLRYIYLKKFSQHPA